MSRFTDFPNEADPIADLWNPALLRESRRRFEVETNDTAPGGSRAVPAQSIDINAVLMAARRERAIALRDMLSGLAARVRRAFSRSRDAATLHGTGIGHAA